MLRARKALALGFGVPLVLGFLVPLAAVLLMPGAVAGAALLVRDVADGEDGEDSGNGAGDGEAAFRTPAPPGSPGGSPPWAG